MPKPFVIANSAKQYDKTSLLQFETYLSTLADRKKQEIQTF